MPRKTTSSDSRKSSRSNVEHGHGGLDGEGRAAAQEEGQDERGCAHGRGVGARGDNYSAPIAGVMVTFWVWSIVGTFVALRTRQKYQMLHDEMVEIIGPRGRG